MVAKKPVESLADISGLRLHLHLDELAAPAWRHLGAEVRTLGWTEVYESLGRGIVEAGRIDRVVELPCSWPTSCTFGGDRLDTLYVTSARYTMGEDHLASRPWEGGLFRIDVGVGGLPTNQTELGDNLGRMRH